MRKINFIHGKDLDDLEQIIKERQGGRNRILFTRRKKDLEKAWIEYSKSEGNINDFEQNQVMWQKNKTSYIGLYNNASGIVLQKKNEIKKSMMGLASCPYCGLPMLQTLDHYLPKTIFPEFSFMFQNLVPCCFDCNLIKKEKVQNDKGSYFLHPYFEKQLINQLLEFEISFFCDTPIFKINVNPSIVGDLRSNVEFQIEELELQRRLSKAAKTPWNGIVNKLKDISENKSWSRNEIKNHLLTKRDDYLYEYKSKNYIHFLVYDSMSSSTLVLDKLLKISKEKIHFLI